MHMRVNVHVDGVARVARVSSITASETKLTPFAVCGLDRRKQPPYSSYKYVRLPVIELRSLSFHGNVITQTVSHEIDF